MLGSVDVASVSPFSLYFSFVLRVCVMLGYHF